MQLKFKHFVFLNVLDAITTYLALTQGHNELNPMYSYVFSHFGLLFGLITIKLFGLMVLYWLILSIPSEIKIKVLNNINGRTLGLMLICAMFAFVVINNSYQMIRVI